MDVSFLALLMKQIRNKKKIATLIKWQTPYACACLGEELNQNLPWFKKRQWKLTNNHSNKNICLFTTRKKYYKKQLCIKILEELNDKICKYLKSIYEWKGTKQPSRNSDNE